MSRLRLPYRVWQFMGGSLYERAYQESHQAVAWFKTEWANKITRSTEPNRTFQAYVTEYQLTEADLGRIYRRHRGFFYFLVGCALLALGYSTSAAFSTFGTGMAGVTVLMALLFLANAARHSLRCWQIQERRLGSFREWLHQPCAWFPLNFS